MVWPTNILYNNIQASEFSRTFYETMDKNLVERVREKKGEGFMSAPISECERSLRHVNWDLSDTKITIRLHQEFVQSLWEKNRLTVSLPCLEIQNPPQINCFYHSKIPPHFPP